jgi:hypothetical protein
MRYDVLELTGLGGATTQTVRVKRGSFNLDPAGCLSYVVFDDEQAARTYVALHTLERWRYSDQSRTA